MALALLVVVFAVDLGSWAGKVPTNVVLFGRVVSGVEVVSIAPVTMSKVPFASTSYEKPAILG